MRPRTRIQSRTPAQKTTAGAGTLEGSTSVLSRVPGPHGRYPTLGTAPRSLQPHKPHRTWPGQRTEPGGGKAGASPNFFEERVLGVKLLQRQDGGVHSRPQHLAVVAGEQSGESGDLQGQGTDDLHVSGGQIPEMRDGQPVPATGQTDRTHMQGF